jgi:hypothetical protein
MYQMAVQYTKQLRNRPNGYKIYQHLPVKDPQKFTQIGIFDFENTPSGNPGST